ncbi:MAG: glutamate mutase L [Anaerolineae bacterium]|nr:glutamate mutase L [Anaerolineae bacterium]
MTEKPFNSILTADFGSVNTRVALIGLANGRYRLLARAQSPTTAEPPFGDVGDGLRHALALLQRMTGRVFVNEGGYLIKPERDDGAGVDQFVATASGGRPMRAVLMGLVPEISVESGRRACNATYMSIEDTVHLGDPRTEVEQIESILRVRPDVLLIVGGTDAGSEKAVMRLVNLAEMALSLTEVGKRPRVLFAGNAELHEPVKAILATLEGVELYLAENVRPSLADETLEPAQARLGSLYDDYITGSPGGFAEVSQWSQVGVLPTAQSVSQILSFLEATQPVPPGGAQLPVLGVDIGSATTMVAAAWQKRRYVSVRSDLGLGHSAVTALDAIDLAALAGWLAFEAEAEDLHDYVWNKWLRPATIPQSQTDWEIEMAFAREIIRAALAGALPGWRRLPRQGDFLPDSSAIVLAGAIFEQPPHPGYAALLALDALQPVGRTRLLRDPYGLLAGMGAFSYVGALTDLAPLAVAQVLNSGGLPALGTVLAPVGRPRSKQTAMQVTLYSMRPDEAAASNGRGRRRRKDKEEERRSLSVKVRAGGIAVIPLAPGARARVVVKPHRRWDIGAGPGKEMSFVAEGSVLGLVCDARGRPLELPDKMEDRARLYPRWVDQITGKERVQPVEAAQAGIEAMAEEAEEAEEMEEVVEAEEAVEADESFDLDEFEF